MYRIRFHGRGGQGMKMASHILGTALFLADFEVQDAPRFGAERRGAPIFAYVRADTKNINERGVINAPDLVIVADDSLVTLPQAGVLTGVEEHTVLFIASREDAVVWQQRLALSCPVLSMDIVGNDMRGSGGQKFFGTICAGAAAALTGLVEREHLEEAIETELQHFSQDILEENRTRALAAYDAMFIHQGLVVEGTARSARNYQRPEWVIIPTDDAHISAPVIHGSGTSTLAQTGTWRLVRPQIDADKCKGCWWVCSTYCPDSAIEVVDNKPHIQYDHCKGCMVCMVQCSAGAISQVDEKEAVIS